MREATADDLPYFIEAAETFTKDTPYRFDPNSYGQRVMELIGSPAFLSSVANEPPTGHCAALIYESLYDRNQRICNIFTTWGRGGLDCFRDVLRQAKAAGCDIVIADSWIEPRIMQAYKRLGFEQADIKFVRALNGH